MLLTKLQREDRIGYLNRLKGKLSVQTISKLIKLNCLHDSYIQKIELNYRTTSFHKQYIDIVFGINYEGVSYSVLCKNVLSCNMAMNYLSHRDAGCWIVDTALDVNEGSLNIIFVMKDWGDIESKIQIKAQRIIIK